MKWRKPKYSILIIIRNDPEQFQLHADVSQSRHRSGNSYSIVLFLTLRIHAFVALLKYSFKLMGTFPG